jgi:alkanesulfonate monooxygenase SsuD/methylene tetrahydromethanopterin reductase-like flavin-dependent oxidoreductase (luciferase family)
MKRWGRCAPSGAKTGRHLRAITIRPKACWQSRARYGNRVLRYGSAAGGSEAGLRRTARLGDGWLASAYNTTPEAFADARSRLGKHLKTAGKNPDRFPNAIATMFFHVTEDRAAADHIFMDVLTSMLRRPAEELRQRLLIGPAGACAEKLDAYLSAGVQRIMLWPVKDELRQLQAFHEHFVPRRA